MIGTLVTVPALERPELLAPPVLAGLAELPWVDEVAVASIDPELADTASFCAAYEVPLEVSANCVVVTGKRDGAPRTAACLVLATTRADVNTLVKRRLDVRKASFLGMDDAVEQTGMAYGGITPVGLPSHWPVLVDAAVVEVPYVVVGSGRRDSKLALPGHRLPELPRAEVVVGLALPPR